MLTSLSLSGSHQFHPTMHFSIFLFFLTIHSFFIYLFCPRSLVPSLLFLTHHFLLGWKLMQLLFLLLYLFCFHFELKRLCTYSHFNSNIDQWLDTNFWIRYGRWSACSWILKSSNHLISTWTSLLFPFSYFSILFSICLIPIQ